MKPYLVFVLIFLFLPTLLIAGIVQLPKTGQTSCYDASGNVITCEGTGQDGDIQYGVEWPDPRFTDNGDGTVNDNLTGLVWLKDANCFGAQVWEVALLSSNGLADGSCGLSDGSVEGDWHLPNIYELKSLVDIRQSDPPLSSGHPFTNIYSNLNNSHYFSSTTSPNPTSPEVRVISMSSGLADDDGTQSNPSGVWPVRVGSANSTINLPKTGQTLCYNALENEIPCAGTGQDGDLQLGTTWPSPRFTDNSDGTVTDNLTALVWLKDPNCLGEQNWQDSLLSANGLANGSCGLSDGSIAGDWRLPNHFEMGSITDYFSPTTFFNELPFADFTWWLNFWTSSTASIFTNKAWTHTTSTGEEGHGFKTELYGVWPVRDGQSTLPLQTPTLSTSTNGVDLTASWTTVTGATGYELYYAPYPYAGPDSISSIDVENTTIFNYTLWDGASYYLAVKAYNDQESSSYSNIEVVNIEAVSFPPEAPELSVSKSGLDLSLSWNAVPDATGYILNYAPSPYFGPASFTTVDVGTDTSFSATLWDGAAFTVAVQAYNDQGGSYYSNIESFVIDQEVFTVDWLSGKTLYTVWFGGTDLDNDSVGVDELVFNSNQTITSTSLLNSESENGTFAYAITDGALHGADDSSGRSTITCTTADYLQIEYTINGEFDNVDRYYFDKSAALAYANTLTDQIPRICN